MVIGGGEVAARKIELLLKSSKQITVMANTVSLSVERLIKEHQLTYLAHDYHGGLLTGLTLVIAATDDSNVNKAIANEATQLGILVNVVDQPELCTYITPAIIDRSPMIIALSSSGSAPILLRMLRESIEKTLPEHYGRLAEFSFKFRDKVKQTVKGLPNRRVFWETVLRGKIGEKVLDGNIKKAENDFNALLDEGVSPSSGKLSFLHTFTGEADNLTLKAHRCLQFADTVYYSDEVNITLLEYVRRDAEKFPYVKLQLSQTIDTALEEAKQGKKVIFLLSDTLDLTQYITEKNHSQIEHFFSGSYSD